jgi:hypothetical protein
VNSHIDGSKMAPHLLAVFPAKEGLVPVRIINYDAIQAMDVHIGIIEIPSSDSPPGALFEAVRNEKWYSLGTVLPSIWDTPINVELGKRYQMDIVTRRARFMERLQILADPSVPGGWRESQCVYGDDGKPITANQGSCDFKWNLKQ